MSASQDDSVEPSRAQRVMFAVAWLVLAALLFIGFLLVLFVPTIYGDSQYSLWADLRRMGLGASGEPGALVDILCAPEEPEGIVAVGTVHHIAWRARDDQQQLQWLDTIGRLGYNVTPVMDRTYFHSIYYLEPGGVLFEIATDPPGFAVDEAAEDLGTRLQLPTRLEPHRKELEGVLPRVRLPQWHAGVS